MDLILTKLQKFPENIYAHQIIIGYAMQLHHWSVFLLLTFGITISGACAIATYFKQPSSPEPYRRAQNANENVAPNFQIVLNLATRMAHFASHMQQVHYYERLCRFQFSYICRYMSSSTTDRNSSQSEVIYAKHATSFTFSTANG